MRVVTVLGTRPEVIKLAPVIGELRRRPQGETVIVATGQHRELLDQMLAQFELAADVDLDLMRPDQRLSDLTAELVRGLGESLRTLEPDWEIPANPWVIQVDGRPTVTNIVSFLPPADFQAETLEEFMVLGHIVTAMPPINAIPAVVAASPGIVMMGYQYQPYTANTVSARFTYLW